MKTGVHETLHCVQVSLFYGYTHFDSKILDWAICGPTEVKNFFLKFCIYYTHFLPHFQDTQSIETEILIANISKPVT